MFTFLMRKFCVHAIPRPAKKACRPFNGKCLLRYVRFHHYDVSVRVHPARSPLSRNCRTKAIAKMNANTIIFGIDRQFCGRAPESNAPIPEQLLEHNTKLSRGNDL